MYLESNKYFERIFSDYRVFFNSQKIKGLSWTNAEIKGMLDELTTLNSHA